jgi:peptide/nickel transport system substrate-binding protein
MASFGAAVALVVSMSAVGVAQSPSPSPIPMLPPAVTPPALTADITSYPNYGGDVTCATADKAGSFNGLPYSGNLKKMEAPDAHTVVFTFCNPDVAFLSQIGFKSLAIEDANYLIAHMADGSILDKPNGTGPYMLASWDKGNRMDFVANPDYWGTKALSPKVELQWSEQSAARLVALQSGSVDGIDNPGKDDMPAILGDGSLAFYQRPGLNTFYLGMNNTIKPWNNQKVRQAIAMGIDRQRIVDNFLPPGSEVAKYFTPCGIPDACGGDPFYTFDPVAAKKLLDEGLKEEGIDPATFTTKIQFRDADRAYISNQPVVAQEVAAQLQANLGISATLDQQDSATFLHNSQINKLDGIFQLGWGADYPDASNFLDYHFASGVRFGTLFPDLVAAIKKGGQTADDAARTAAYTEANNLIKQYVPAVFISHAGSGTAFKSDVQGAYADPWSTEAFAGVQATGRDIVVFMQNKEPISLYCGDETDGETLRACRQIQEPLYTYGGKSGLDPVPALATGCTPNADLTVWTCTLRDGVKFQDGSTLDASDVIVSFAAQWDQLSPQHIGDTGDFAYWDALIGGGKLNPPTPAQ